MKRSRVKRVGDEGGDTYLVKRVRLYIVPSLAVYVPQFVPPCTTDATKLNINKYGTMVEHRRIVVSFSFPFATTSRLFQRDNRYS